MVIKILDSYRVNPGDLSWDRFHEFGDLTIYDRTPLDVFHERIADVEIAITNKLVWDMVAFDAAPHLKLLALSSTGYNVIDMDVARERGVTVCNIPAYSTPDVAQLTIGLMLEHCNRIGLHDHDVHDGGWCSEPDFCYWLTPQRELSGKTLGIIGMGSIGRSVARIAVAFDMEVLFYNPSRHDDCENERCHQVDLAELYRSSDFITLHCPATEATEHMIDAEAISQMKQGAVIVNTARGTLLAEQDVADALQDGRLGGLAVDVVAREPMSPDNPLLSAPNTIITPHMAWATIEARARLIDELYLNIRAFVDGHPRNVVS